MFEIEIKKKALKYAKKLNKKRKNKLIEMLDILESNPLPFKKYDLKKLKGYQDTYRIRIGDIRIVYEINFIKKLIVIHFIGTRGKAY